MTEQRNGFEKMAQANRRDELYNRRVTCALIAGALIVLAFVTFVMFAVAITGGGR